MSVDSSDEETEVAESRVLSSLNSSATRDGNGDNEPEVNAATEDVDKEPRVDEAVVDQSEPLISDEGINSYKNHPLNDILKFDRKHNKMHFQT